jgi:hypothetical protein
MSLHGTIWNWNPAAGIGIPPLELESRRGSWNPTEKMAASAPIPPSGIRWGGNRFAPFGLSFTPAT